MDDDEVKLMEEPSEAAEVEGAEEGKGRKIYRGRTVTVAALQEELARLGALPVQPMTRMIPGSGKEYELPPSFILTKFTPGYVKNTTTAHYYHPASSAVSYRTLPLDFELNVLEGKRGAELTAEWEKTKEQRLYLLTRKIGCTIGADPEIFAEKEGEVYPAWKYAGSKAAPDTWNFAGTFCGNVYWDGFQAEFTTPGNIACLMHMSDTIHAGLGRINSLAVGKKAKLSLKSVYEVNPDVLAKCKEEHVAFGCSPSKNVYGLSGNIRDGREVPYRFAGGHIHFGLADRNEEQHLRPLVRTLDAILGVACVSLFANFDSPIRRQFYGQPGEYRTPPHGLEYRVLSNAWLSHPLVFHLVFDLARAAAGLRVNGFHGLWKAEEQEVIETILHHDVKKAREILTRNLGTLRGVLGSSGGSYIQGAEVAARVFLEGMESAVKAPEDIVGNWRLGGHWSHGEHMFASYLPRLQAGGKV